ncbi:MAG: hypothetical protein ACLTC4_23625 [Hungatella hathewayi]
MDIRDGRALVVILGSAAAVSCYGFPTPIQAQLDIRPENMPKRVPDIRRTREAKPVEAGASGMLNQLPTIETGARTATSNTRTRRKTITAPESVCI